MAEGKKWSLSLDSKSLDHHICPQNTLLKNRLFKGQLSHRERLKCFQWHFIFPDVTELEWPSPKMALHPIPAPCGALLPWTWLVCMTTEHGRSDSCHYLIGHRRLSSIAAAPSHLLPAPMSTTPGEVCMEMSKTSSHLCTE